METKNSFRDIVLWTAMLISISSCNNSLIQTFKSTNPNTVPQDQFGKGTGFIGEWQPDSIEQMSLDDLRNQCIISQNIYQDLKEQVEYWLITGYSQNEIRKKLLKAFEQKLFWYWKFSTKEDELFILASDSIWSIVTKSRNIANSRCLEKWYNNQDIWEIAQTWLDTAKTLNSAQEQTWYILDQISKNCSYVHDSITIGKYIQGGNTIDWFFEIKHFIKVGGDCDDFATTAYGLLRFGLDIDCHFIEFPGHADIAIPKEWITENRDMGSSYWYNYQNKAYSLVHCQLANAYESMKFKNFNILAQGSALKKELSQEHIVEYTKNPHLLITRLKDSIADHHISYEQLSQRSAKNIMDFKLDGKWLWTYATALWITGELAINRKERKKFLELLYTE